MIKTKKIFLLKIVLLFFMCLGSLFVANDTNYAAENENGVTTIDISYTAENDNGVTINDTDYATQAKKGVTIKQYEKNVKHLSRISANETMDKFNSGEGFYFYIGRPSCYYCREFSPILKEFSWRISQPIYYYNQDGGDWGPEIRQFLKDHINLQGTPTLAYIKDGKVVAQQVGTGVNADELQTIFADCPQ
ncbi:thiol reductase thioredoxin [Paenibacillus sp. NPDC055715]